MSVRGVLVTIVGLVGAACIVGGIVALTSAEDHSGDFSGGYSALGRAIVGGALILVGGTVLSFALAYAVTRPGPSDAKKRPARRVDPPASELPEARVHGRPPDPRNGN